MRACLSIFGLLFSFQLGAQAQNLSGADPKPDFQQIQCKSTETDQIGALGLVNENFSARQTNESVILTTTSTLYVCSSTTDGTQVLSWKVANPYTGFQVQYYNDATQSLQSRKVFIDPAKPFNRMKLVSFIFGDHSSVTVNDATMTPTGTDSFTGTVTLKMSDLLNAQDLKALKAGQTVAKMVELDQVSNFTTYYANGEELLTGDEGRSGRNVFLNFKQEGQKIVLTNVSK